MFEKLSQISTVTMFTGLLVVGFQNCGSSDGEALSKASANQNVTYDEIQRRYKDLQDMAASDLHCVQAADCEAVAVGSKGCGGPTGYLVASVLNEMWDNILTLADELKVVEQKYNSQNGMISDCMFMMPPELQCQNLICKQKL